MAGMGRGFDVATDKEEFMRPEVYAKLDDSGDRLIAGQNRHPVAHKMRDEEGETVDLSNP
jgi:hypothetical protein